jgi:hypothetical protein
MTGNPAGPLDGITVLDLCRYRAGGCMLLADPGADVIEIDSPQGDMLRQFPSGLSGERRCFGRLRRGAVDHRGFGLSRPQTNPSASPVDCLASLSMSRTIAPHGSALSVFARMRALAVRAISAFAVG